MFFLAICLPTDERQYMVFIINMSELVYDASFQTPFNMIVSGPSGSGKSVFVQKLLDSPILGTKPREVVWCYGVWQRE